MLSEIDLRPFPACPPDFNLAAHVLARGQETPNRPALILVGDTDQSLTHAELRRLVTGCATFLLARGLRPGDRVLMRLGNGLAFPILFLGAIWAGLVPVPTASGLTTGEISRAAAIVSPSLIVAEPGLALPDYPAPDRSPPVIAPDLAHWGKLPPAPADLGDPGREAYVVFTSGTSGTPMAVSHAHRVILARAVMHQAWQGLTPADRLLHAGALNWTYTLGTGLLDPWTLGATALIPVAGTAPAALPALLHRHQVTIIAAAPGVYRQMLRGTFPPLPQLRHGLSAGEALPEPIRQDWQRATGTDLHQALGLSEINTFISGSPRLPLPPGASGYVQPGRHVAILREDGTPVLRGEAGELAVSTADPGLMRGYLGQPAPTGPWFRTGDGAVMDADGAITHLGRLDDLLNASGFRISPVEIEAAFHGLPGLLASAAVEVEVKPGTRIIALFYESSCAIDGQSLHQRAEKTLAHWKQPRHYQRLDTLPRTQNGKIIRRALIGAYRTKDHDPA